MTDYPQHIVAEACRIASEQATGGHTRWLAGDANHSIIQAICLALTMTPPEPPKDVLVEAYAKAARFVVRQKDVDDLRTELARLGHEVAPIRQPVSEEVIEREAVELWEAHRLGSTTHKQDLAIALRRDIALAGGK